MQSARNNHAFIDGANLHKGAGSHGWSFDYRRFRTWLRERHGVQVARIFIGYVKSNESLYAYLRHAGYILVFKETVRDGAGHIKGNCDADLVLWTVRGAYEKQYERAIIVSSDGDYASLVKFLLDRELLGCVISPSDKCSYLIRKMPVPITYLRDIQTHVEQSKSKRAPGADGTAQGSLSW